MDTRAPFRVAGTLLPLSLLYAVHATNPVAVEHDLRRAVAFHQPFAVWRPLVIELGLSVPQDRFMGTMRDVISSMCALTVGGPFMNPVYAARAARLTRRFANGIGAVLLYDGIRSSSLRLTRVALQVTQANPFHMCLAILRSLELSPQSALHVSGEIARRQPMSLLSLCVDNRISFLDAVRSEHASNRLRALLLVTRQFSQTFSIDENLLLVDGLREFMQCEVNLAEMIDFGASVNGMPDNNVPSGDAVVERRSKRNGKMRDDGMDEVCLIRTFITG